MTAEELARHDATRTEYETLDAEYAASSDYSEEIEQKVEEFGMALDKLR